MAATQTLVTEPIESKKPREYVGSIPIVTTAALTVLAVLIHGYHPYAEDGGIYLPGILKLIHPELYPTWTGFVTAQTRFSLFAPAVAAVVRFTGMSMMLFMFIVYVLSVWGTVYAAWMLAVRCVKGKEARFGAIAIFALCMTMPAAGTSLLLVDPYVTARTISTPLGLLAMVGTLDLIAEFRKSGRVAVRPLVIAIGSLLFAASMHPLMAAYAGCCAILLVCASITNALMRNALFAGLGIFAFLIGALVNWLAPAQPTDYAAVALSRTYWFLSNWRWYELIGLVAPLLLLSGLSRCTSVLSERGRWLARMGVYAGLIALEISVIFAHRSAHTYFVAMLQPLRLFHMVYIVMILLIGAMLAAVLLERNPLRWAVIFLVLGTLMLFAQIQTFPHSTHIELPGRTPYNDWQQGFMWIQRNTPVDATFAMDTRYIDSDGEDAQSFRAIAQRSSVPDYTKDGGIAAIDPALTADWTKGEEIQSGLAKASDKERVRKLALANVQWMVLPGSSITGLPCPYRNKAMQVCRIPAN